MIYEMKYLCSNWEIKTSPFHPNMEILGSFIACINELATSVKNRLPGRCGRCRFEIGKNLAF